MDPVVVAYFQFGGIDITDARHLSQATTPNETEQGNVDPFFDLDETVVGKGCREVGFQLPQNTVLVVVFKAFVTTEVVINANGHHLRGRKAAFQ
jgi:hypothetical protein